MPIPSCQGEGNIADSAHGKVVGGHGGVAEPVHAWTFQAREPGDPIGIQVIENLDELDRSANLSEGTADMNTDGKSDASVVLSTRANNTAAAVAELVEERGALKGTVVDRRGRTGLSAGVYVNSTARQRRLVANVFVIV